MRSHFLFAWCLLLCFTNLKAQNDVVFLVSGVIDKPLQTQQQYRISYIDPEPSLTGVRAQLLFVLGTYYTIGFSVEKFLPRTDDGHWVTTYPVQAYSGQITRSGSSFSLHVGYQPAFLLIDERWHFDLGGNFGMRRTGWEGTFDDPWSNNSVQSIQTTTSIALTPMFSAFYKQGRFYGYGSAGCVLGLIDKPWPSSRASGQLSVGIGLALAEQ